MDRSPECPSPSAPLVSLLTRRLSRRPAPEFCVSLMLEVGSFLAPPRVVQCSDQLLTRISSAGHLRTLNELAKKANADYIIHTGDFGFYDDSSLERIADKFVSFPFVLASHIPRLSKKKRKPHMGTE